MVEFWTGLSSGLRSSLVITTFLMTILVLMGQRVARLKTSDVPGGFTMNL